MILASNAFFSLFLAPFGLTACSLILTEGGIEAQTDKMQFIPFSEISASPLLKVGLLSSTVMLNRDDGTSVTLRGAKKRCAKKFILAAADAWRGHNLSAFDAASGQVEHLLSRLEELSSPRTYPSACKIQPVLAEAEDLDTRLIKKLWPDAIGADAFNRLNPIRDFVTQPDRLRDAAISIFVNSELERWRGFFDTVESKPLTPEQRLSIVVDEDATLVLAGAGSGKTSVITAKAAYLLKAGIRQAEEILLLAFARDAATEMSERIEARCGVPVQAQTFHALAYDIIGHVEGSKPALAAHATDDAAFLALIRQILKQLVQTVVEVAVAVINWFSNFLFEPHDEWDFQSKHEFYTQVEKQDLRTLQGEQVKSYEELQIANWLYVNGISYEYEPDYAHPSSQNGLRDYTPDFRLTESGIYLEHFGVRRERAEDGSVRLVTAPFVNREEYLAQMEWKRQLHEKHGTVLIETYSYERQEGRLLEALAGKLKPYVQPSPRPPSTIYDRVVELGYADAFTRMLGTFLRQFKSGGYKVEDCRAKAGRLKMGTRAQAFLAVFDPVYREYQKQLGKRIDFEDMILRAAQYVVDGRYKSPFRHILVDEFQDISQSRARLIKALKAQHPDGRLFAVGDDWQSIYRFAGSDIHIMRNFGEEFGGRFAATSSVHRTVDLGRTFRSVDKLALSARQFVLKNPAQIKKTVIPAGQAVGPAIKIAWTRRGDNSEGLHQALGNIASVLQNGTGPTSVLLLGRYRHLEPDLRQLRKRFSTLSIEFKTIHASKGLEADHVVLLGADRGRAGFPSEITDDPLLSLVSPEAEPFPHAEERRVMYVAMTRARYSLTILASEARPSDFVTELRKDPAYEVAPSVEAGTSVLTTYECMECEGRLLPYRTGTGRLRFRCEHTHLCGTSLPACTSCQTALPRRPDDGIHSICERCSTVHPVCPACKDGWLVERQGRFGSFLGCVRYPACDGKARQTSLPNSEKQAAKTLSTSVRP